MAKKETLQKVSNFLSLHGIKHKVFEDEQKIVAHTVNGDTVNYYVKTGCVESAGYEQHGKDGLLAVCMGEPLRLKKHKSHDKTVHNRRVADYMGIDDLERKSDMIQWCHNHGIIYHAKHALVTVTRKEGTLPYKTYDKEFIYNSKTDIVKDANGNRVVPRGAETLKKILSGSLDYGYAVDGGSCPMFFRYSPEYEETMRRVRTRDGYRCRRCGRKDAEIPLEVHHIKSYKDVAEGRMDMDNMISVCPVCHMMKDLEDGTLTDILKGFE